MFWTDVQATICNQAVSLPRTIERLDDNRQVKLPNSRHIVLRRTTVKLILLRLIDELIKKKVIEPKGYKPKTFIYTKIYIN